jgi:hypothetical protein
VKLERGTEIEVVRKNLSFSESFFFQNSPAVVVMSEMTPAPIEIKDEEPAAWRHRSSIRAVYEFGIFASPAVDPR